ncbi:MAG: hypothetical protein ABI611_09285 [Solirubrobacteraceae bacterium]
MRGIRGAISHPALRRGVLAWLRGAGGVTGRLRQRTLGGVLAPVAGRQVAILVGERTIDAPRAWVDEAVTVPAAP